MAIETLDLDISGLREEHRATLLSASSEDLTDPIGIMGSPSIDTKEGVVSFPYLLQKEGTHPGLEARVEAYEHGAPVMCEGHVLGEISASGWQRADGVIKVTFSFYEHDGGLEAPHIRRLAGMGAAGLCAAMRGIDKMPFEETIIIGGDAWLNDIPPEVYQEMCTTGAGMLSFDGKRFTLPL